jgi:hypothetical protein
MVNAGRLSQFAMEAIHPAPLRIQHSGLKECTANIGWLILSIDVALRSSNNIDSQMDIKAVALMINRVSSRRPTINGTGLSAGFHRQQQQQRLVREYFGIKNLPCR